MIALLVWSLGTSTAAAVDVLEFFPFIGRAQFTSLAAFPVPTAATPLLPDAVHDGSFVFAFVAGPEVADETLWIDPPVATGYEYAIFSSSDAVRFDSVTAPTLGDPDGYTLTFGSTAVPLAEGEAFAFPQPVDAFTITDIDPSLWLDPTDTRAFHSGVSLTVPVEPQRVVVTQTPLETPAATGVIVGDDLNSAANGFVQPQDDALAGGGIDQSLQRADMIEGTAADNVLVGNLGEDLLLGGGGNDVIVGGPENGNPPNRDRAFGGPGNDFFLWAGGDGTDFFAGGPGFDVLLFGLLARADGDGTPVFDDGLLFIDLGTGLPRVNVAATPGFCKVIDQTNIDSEQPAAALDALGVDHLVRFFSREVANAFDAGGQTTDNGLRVTLHLRDVELLVCLGRDQQARGTFVDLTTAPAAVLDFEEPQAFIPEPVLETLGSLILLDGAFGPLEP